MISFCKYGKNAPYSRRKMHRIEIFLRRMFICLPPISLGLLSLVFGQG